MTDIRIVFIHGFMGSALNWGRIRMLIEDSGRAAVPPQNIKAFAVDLLGHALNHPTPAQKLIPAHQALTDNLRTQLAEIRPTHVVAHSFGFRPALLLGLSNPELVPHLVVEDSSPELSRSGHKFLSEVINAPVPFRTRELAKEYFENKYGVQTVLSRFFMSNIRSREDGLADWRFDKDFLQALLDEALAEPLWQQWQNFPGQCDLIYGANSEGMADWLVQKMKDAQPGLRLWPIPKAGHWVHSDQPEAFVQSLVKLLESTT